MSFDRTHIVETFQKELIACSDQQAFENLRIRYLGRKGVLQELMSKIPTLPQQERKVYGAQVNALKAEILECFLDAERQRELHSTGCWSNKESSFMDATLPGKQVVLGRRHPIIQVQNEICEIFKNLGFQVFDGPEIETEYNNFQALNIPLDHPSRDAFDTFYLEAAFKEKLLLRSHTSPAQIRAMKAHKPPLAVIVPGRVYRPDAVDASHSFMFHQVEGFAVSENVRFSDLKGILAVFARQMFGTKTKTRFRPSFFPFTEPSAEVDVSCIICDGKGCSVCKKSGWLEILGCGMIHPHVFKSVGYDVNRWRGFAFGMGVERIAMLKFGINDIRMFFENDIRFLEQF
ncbi:MAG: phenylalanine--tRNA ligase subunit alpha [Candidatus Omnitrophota bacterium]